MGRCEGLESDEAPRAATAVLTNGLNCPRWNVRAGVKKVADISPPLSGKVCQEDEDVPVQPAEEQQQYNSSCCSKLKLGANGAPCGRSALKELRPD